MLSRRAILPLEVVIDFAPAVPADNLNGGTFGLNNARALRERKRGFGRY